MSWCDKLASTATAGFKLNYRFAPSEEVLGALSPILDPLVKENKEQFSVDGIEAFAFSFTTFEGYKYAVDPSKISVAFQHRVRHKLTSGGPPTMEMLSTPMPFTKLLPVVCDKLQTATLMLPSAKTRKVERVGIISTTRVAEEEVPPGIARFFKYIGRPWKEDTLDDFQIRLAAPLASADSHADRCIHTFQKFEDKSELLNLTLDWQRTFSNPKAVAQDSLADILKSARKDAEKYFEDVAEGSMFDEELIRSP